MHKQSLPWGEITPFMPLSLGIPQQPWLGSRTKPRQTGIDLLRSYFGG